MRSCATAVFALLTLWYPAASARAGEPTEGERETASRWRVLAGGGWSGSSFATTYLSRYAPPFESAAHTSTATQTLPLDAGRGFALQLGVERSLGAHVGLQLLADHAEADLTGEPGRYDLTLTYTSRPPPSNEPVEVTLQRSVAGPAATGRLQSLTLALNLAAWIDAGAHARLGVSVGPSWLRTSGWAQSLVYSTFTLGGHSVLFSEDHLVSFDFAASGIGVDASCFVEADLGRRVGLRFDARYSWGAERAADVTLREVVNAEEIVRSVPLADIEAGLSPAPLRIDPASFRVGLLLSLRF